MKTYSQEFREEALKLSDEIGVNNAASQLITHRMTGRANARKHSRKNYSSKP